MKAIRLVMDNPITHRNPIAMQLQNKLFRARIVPSKRQYKRRPRGRGMDQDR